jgi:hypothetical protein
MRIQLVSKLYLQTLNPIMFMYNQSKSWWYNDTFHYNFHYGLRTKSFNYINIKKRHKTRPWQSFITSYFQRTFSVLISPQHISKMYLRKTIPLVQTQQFPLFTLRSWNFSANTTIFRLFTRIKRKMPTVMNNWNLKVFYINFIQKYTLERWPWE